MTIQNKSTNQQNNHHPYCDINSPRFNKACNCDAQYTNQQDFMPPDDVKLDRYQDEITGDWILYVRCGSKEMMNNMYKACKNKYVELYEQPTE